MSTKRSILGTWHLVSCEHRLKSGKLLHPYGTNPKGILVYTDDGYMSANLSAPLRGLFKSTDLFGGEPDELIEAAKTYLHYGGKYKLFDEHVEHYVEVSLFPNWVGTTQKRYFRFHGEQLELFTNPFYSQGSQQTAHLMWERCRA